MSRGGCSRLVEISQKWYAGPPGDPWEKKNERKNQVHKVRTQYLPSPPRYMYVRRGHENILVAGHIVVTRGPQGRGHCGVGRWGIDSPLIKTERIALESRLLKGGTGVTLAVAKSLQCVVAQSLQCIVAYSLECIGASKLLILREARGRHDVKKTNGKGHLKVWEGWGRLYPTKCCHMG
eukprot:gene18115-biopygen5249